MGRLKRRGWWYAVAGIMLLIALGGLTVYLQSHGYRHRVTTIKEPPVLVDKFQTRQGAKPAWVYWSEGKLFVSYYDSDVIDICSPEGKLLKSFVGTVNKGEGAPQGMGMVSGRLFVADYTNKALEVFGPQGDFQEAFNKKPNQEEIIPVGVAVYNRVVYVTDKKTKGWMAIGDDGEFISVAGGTSEKDTMEFPYGIVVSSDGRVVVTDPVLGKIKAFSCRGAFAYDFVGSELGLKNPEGISMDGLGRFQVVDNGSNQIFVYSNTGYLLFRYGDGLDRPSTITVDEIARHIYVANTEKNEIVVYGY